jgi:hypothetical protein
MTGRPHGLDVAWVSRDGTSWKVDASFDTSAGPPTLVLPNGHGLVAFQAFSAALPPGNTYVSVGGAPSK